MVPYAVASDMQRALVEERRAERVPDTLLLLEHPHVITLGVKVDAARSHLIATPDLLAARQVEVHETGRGGDITYHGPGQIVGYPILDLRPDRCDVHRYVRDLEDVMIRTARDFGLESARITGLSGAWVGADKIGAIGVRISRWITSHGFALNVTTDLDFFKLIVPCGIDDRWRDVPVARGRASHLHTGCRGGDRAEFFGGIRSDRCRGRRQMKMIYRPTMLTLAGVGATIAAISGTTGYILGRAPSIPFMLPVHFDDEAIADRFVRASYAVILVPVWIQLALAIVFGAIAGVLLYRTQKTRSTIENEVNRQERERMLMTAEAISLLAAIWVTFQGLLAIRLIMMWQLMCCGLGDIYYQSLVVCIVCSALVGVRAAVYLQYPKPVARQTEDVHWRFRSLYFNRQDPSLFVSRRNGPGWTVNFGRPQVIVFFGLAVLVSIGAPILILKRPARGIKPAPRVFL